MQQGSVETPSGDQVFTVVPLFGDPRFLPGLRVAVVAPAQSLTSAWTDTLPRLSMAALKFFATWKRSTTGLAFGNRL